ncbi:TPA: IcmT/TraK family protein [Yersinia enterocolitica]
MNVHWRWNLEPKIAGIPGYAFIPLLLSIYVDSLNFFFMMVGVVILYGVLSHFGFTISTLIGRVKHRLRGNIVHSRPWWFIKRFKGNYHE